MAERGIIFPTWKVQALLAGRLDLDVRPLRVGGVIADCGDTLWVCETWRPMWRCEVCPEPGAGVEYGWPEADRCPSCKLGPLYKADDPTTLDGSETWDGKPVPWRRAKTMPRAHSRIWLEVVEVTACRVKDIAEADADRAGVELFSHVASAFGEDGYRLALAARWDEAFGSTRFMAAPAALAWGSNPWAIFTEVRRIGPPAAGGVRG